MADRGTKDRSSPSQPAARNGSQGPTTSSSQGPHQFDFLNWYYWSLWWQQYSYWLWQLQTPQFTPEGNWLGPSPHPNTDTNSSASQSARNGGSDAANQIPGYQSQWAQYYNHQMNPQVPPGPPLQRRPPSAGATGQHFTRTPHQGGLTLTIRIIIGYETVIAPVLKRLIAELIDIILFALLLKAYMPELDYRIPEVVFQGSNVWADLAEEDLLEIKDTLMVFLFSVILQRMLHGFMETVLVAVFACTPGKWLMGLRVLRCSAIHYTRTQPGYTVRIEPGGKLPFLHALFRATFKSTVSLFCPLVVFFFSLDKGRTKYDELIQSTVVDVHTLYKPVYAEPIRGQPRPLVQAG